MPTQVDPGGLTLHKGKALPSTQLQLWAAAQTRQQKGCSQSGQERASVIAGGAEPQVGGGGGLLSVLPLGIRSWRSKGRAVDPSVRGDKGALPQQPRPPSHSERVLSTAALIPLQLSQRVVCLRKKVAGSRGKGALIPLQRRHLRGENGSGLARVLWRLPHCSQIPPAGA